MENIEKINAAKFNSDYDDVFSRIAKKYDILCDLFSFFIQRYWKSEMAAEIVNAKPALILDVASGTGDIPLRILNKISTKKVKDIKQIIVSDICTEMLDVAKNKIGKNSDLINYKILNSYNLSEISDNSIDLYSISFAMKICNRDKVLKEAYRVLKPGGIFMCLEASTIPNKWLYKVYLMYMNFCLPIMAKIATGKDKSTYNYLLRGIEGFPNQVEFSEEIKSYGFNDVSYKNMTVGIVALHKAVKPANKINTITYQNSF